MYREAWKIFSLVPLDRFFQFRKHQRTGDKQLLRVFLPFPSDKSSFLRHFLTYGVGVEKLFLAFILNLTFLYRFSPSLYFCIFIFSSGFVLTLQNKCTVFTYKMREIPSLEFFRNFMQYSIRTVLKPLNRLILGKWGKTFFWASLDYYIKSFLNLI